MLTFKKLLSLLNRNSVAIKSIFNAKTTHSDSFINNCETITRLWELAPQGKDWMELPMCQSPTKDSSTVSPKYQASPKAVGDNGTAQDEPTLTHRHT